MVLRLAFSDKLPYQRNEGFRTAQTSLPFRLLEEFKGGHYDLARPTGKSSNRLFDILQEWDYVLQGTSLESNRNPCLQINSTQ